MQPNRIKLFSNRAMIYLNGKHGGVALCSLEDIDALRPYSWVRRTAMRGGKLREGYVVSYCRSTKKRLLMHRLVAKAPPSLQVDHMNHNTMDNRRENLRLVDNSFNIFHTPKWGPDAGVSFDKSRGKWEAYINRDDTKIHLGRFATKEEALLARREGELFRFGVLKPGKE